MISDTDQEELLNSALKLLDEVPGGAKIYRGHKNNAEKDIERALADLKNNASAEKINQDISSTMREVQTSIALLDGVSGQTAPNNLDSANPLGMDPLRPADTAKRAALTAELARAVVLISGDNGQGTGFIIRTADGPMVVTNIHVIANNPNLKITTNTGAIVKILSAKAASDRDLALLAIQDANYNYLEVSTDIRRTVQPGDEVITPGNRQGDEVMLDTSGKIVDIGPEQIEFDNPINHGNNGGPVFHPKSGKVLGVVSEEMKAVGSGDLDKIPFVSRNPAFDGSTHYFGLRLDTVTGWVPIDWQRFQNESAFLDAFHHESLSLDSYLNSSNDDGDDPYTGDGADLYRSDSKIMKANAEYLEQSIGLDLPQRMLSLQGLVFDLDRIANDDVDQIQNLRNFYSFDEERARNELAYRNALKSELNSLSDDSYRLRQLPKPND
jgi:hypothetical protein